MGPEATMALELFGVACSVILAALRVWVQRHRTRTPPSIAYDVLLFVSLTCYLYITSVDVWSSWRETKLPPGLTQGEMAKRLMDHTFMTRFFAGGICYTVFLWTVKASFIALYFEMSSHLVQRVRLALYMVTAFVVLTFIGNIFLKFFWCLPFDRNWSTGPDKCTFAIALPVNTTTSFLNIATDLTLLALFVFIVYTLQLKNRELIAAVFVGFVGSCTVFAAAIRYGLAYVSFKDSNASWRNTKIMLLWTNIEMGLVLLAVTLPAFRVLLRKKVTKMYGDYGSRSVGDNFHDKAVMGNINTVETELGHIDKMSIGSGSSRRDGGDSIEREPSEGSIKKLFPNKLGGWKNQK